MRLFQIAGLAACVGLSTSAPSTPFRSFNGNTNVNSAMQTAGQYSPKTTDWNTANNSIIIHATYNLRQIESTVLQPIIAAALDLTQGLTNNIGVGDESFLYKSPDGFKFSMNSASVSDALTPDIAKTVVASLNDQATVPSASGSGPVLKSSFTSIIQYLGTDVGYAKVTVP